jgi:alanyl-tRNA synthetase
VLRAQDTRAALDRIHDALHVNESQAVAAIERLQADSKKLAREVTQLKTRLAMGEGASADNSEAADAFKNPEDTETFRTTGTRLVRRHAARLDKEALRALADSLKGQIKTGVIVLASDTDDRVQIVVAVTPDLTPRVKAGQIVKELAPIVGGGGGGRPDFAEAGGKQPEKINEMLRTADTVVARLLAAG